MTATIYAEKRDGAIEVTSEDKTALTFAARMTGAKRIEGGWRVPISESVTEILLSRRAVFGPELQGWIDYQRRVEKYINYCKTADKVEPIQPIPIKAPYTLYQHQIRAYNIALVLFGRGAKRRSENADNG